MGKFGLFVLGVLLGVAGLAFAQQTQVVNPLCSMIQALSANWGVITVFIMVILGGMLVVSAVMYLIQTKFPIALAIIIGGTVLLVATFRFLDVSGEQLRTFSNTCASQVGIVQPVAKSQ